MLSADKQALKRAFSELVEAVGGQVKAAPFTRFIRHQALSDFGNLSEEHEARFAPIDAVADLEGVTHGHAGHPHVTRRLARQAGYALVPLPRPRGGGADIAGHLQAIIRESADVTLTLSNHLHRAPDAPAARSLQREIDEAIRALVELSAELAGSVE